LTQRTLPWRSWHASWLPSQCRQASDGCLLLHYARGREEAAFAALVSRHGPLVWGVCYRLLGNSHDAEDAFQATFLVLARKAGSLRNAGRLPAWLHGVARRTALKLRTRRRKVFPLEYAGEVPERTSPASSVREFQPILDDAIARLPLRFQVPFLLCHGEGLTAMAAAKRLGCPVGTVESRLHRARIRMRQYLGERGVTSAAGALAGAIGLTVPESLLAAALRTVSLPMIPASLLPLLQGVILPMTWTKVTTLCLTACMLGLAGAGATILWAQGGQSSPAAEAKQEEKPSRELAKLREALRRTQDELDQARALAAQSRAQVHLLETERKSLLAQLEALKNQGQATQESAALEEKKIRMRKEEEDRRMLMAREKVKQSLAQSKDKLEQELKKLQVEQTEFLRSAPGLASAGQQDAESKDLQLAMNRLRAFEQEANLTKLERGTESPEYKKQLLFLDNQKKSVQQAQTEYLRIVALQHSYEVLKNRLKVREKLLMEIEERLLRLEMESP
jgi:RNA polymerase sigma factor (sigma-70 family)